MKRGGQTKVIGMERQGTARTHAAMATATAALAIGFATLGSTHALAAEDSDEVRLVVTPEVSPEVTDPGMAPFVQPYNFDSLSISPDGKHIVGIYYDGHGQGVMTIDADTLMPKLVVESKMELNGIWGEKVEAPIWVGWIDNDRIVVNFRKAWPTIYTLDGKAGRVLLGSFLGMFKDASGNGTDWALTYRDHSRKLFERENLKTGEHQDLELDLPGSLQSWAYDAGHEIRAAQTLDTSFWTSKSRVTTWYRASATAKWQEIDTRSVLDMDGFSPLFVPAAAGRIIVQSRNGRDKWGIWSFDADKKAFVDLMAATEDQDLSGEVADLVRKDDLDRVWTTGLRSQVVWFDEQMARLQVAVDQALPGRRNSLTHVWSGRLLVDSSSDIDPGRWYLLDTTTMKLREIVTAMRGVDPQKMRPMKTLRYPSSDGLQVPAYLTLPEATASPPPAVVLVHGGPQARDHWSWDSEVQLLAAHGYAVFQPQFRGSTGFGRRFEEAGYGQWGLAMQDDVTAGVKYLVDHKLADPDRICIVGASYGGYAALWGLAKTPSLYKCGVSAFGVTDINRLLKDIDLHRNVDLAREVNKVWIGDGSKGQDFDAVSPLKHADRIQAPVLIAYGDYDPKVATWHAEDMIAALRKNGKSVRGLEFKYGVHGFWFPDDRRVYYEELLAFLDKNIGAGRPAAVTAGASETAAAH